MRVQVPVARVVIFGLAGVFALALFLFLNNSFGGPQVPPRDVYELRATFPDSQNMVKKSLVMIRGVKVGEVTDIEVVDGKANVNFTVYDKYRPVRQGATAQVGHRTIFGEAIVRLGRGRRDGRELAEGTKLRTLPIVQPDEALQVIGPESRRNLTRAARGLAKALRHPRAAEQLGETYTGLWSVTENLRRMTDALKGQEAQVARLVTSSATVVGVLGERESALRSIMVNGRTVGETWADQAGAIGEGIDELHSLLGVSRDTLAHAAPLMRDVEVVMRGIRGPARDLRPAFVGLKDLLATARGIVFALAPANRFAQPALRRAGELFRKLVPVARDLGVTLGNLIPLFRYVADRRRTFAAFISNIADSVDNRDSSGGWLHGFLIADPRAGVATLPPCSSPGGLCTNAYPDENGPTSFEAYKKGGYPRLRAYLP